LIAISRAHAHAATSVSKARSNSPARARHGGGAASEADDALEPAHSGRARARADNAARRAREDRILALVAAGLGQPPLDCIEISRTPRSSAATRSTLRRRTGVSYASTTVVSPPRPSMRGSGLARLDQRDLV